MRRAVTIAALAVGAIAVSALMQRSRPTAPGAVIPPFGQMPPIVIEGPSKNLGDVLTPYAEHTFRLTNVSASQVRIQEIGKSCGCLEVTLGRRMLMPGESMELRLGARISPKGKGLQTPFRERISVHLAGIDRPIEMELFGVYVPPLYYHSQHVNIPAPPVLGDAFHRDIDIYFNTDKAVRLVDVEANGAGLRAEVRRLDPPQNDGYARAVIRISGNRMRGDLPQFGSVRMRTTAVDLPEVTFDVVVQQREGALPLPAPAQMLVVTGAPGRERELIEASGADQRVRAEFGSRNGDDGSTFITVICHLAGGESGAVDSEVVVRLRYSGEPVTLRVPVSAFIRAKVNGRKEWF